MTVLLPRTTACPTQRQYYTATTIMRPIQPSGTLQFPIIFFPLLLPFRKTGLVGGNALAADWPGFESDGQ